MLEAVSDLRDILSAPGFGCAGRHHLDRILGRLLARGPQAHAALVLLGSAYLAGASLRAPRRCTGGSPRWRRRTRARSISPAPAPSPRAGAPRGARSWKEVREWMGPSEPAFHDWLADADVYGDDPAGG